MMSWHIDSKCLLLVWKCTVFRLHSYQSSRKSACARLHNLFSTKKCTCAMLHNHFSMKKCTCAMLHNYFPRRNAPVQRCTTTFLWRNAFAQPYKTFFLNNEQSSTLIKHLSLHIYVECAKGFDMQLNVCACHIFCVCYSKYNLIICISNITAKLVRS